MSNTSRGAAHLASGIAASRVKAKRRLYVCTGCLDEQKSKYGECYWNRLWQVPLTRVCLDHGPLVGTNIRLDGEHRHAHIPVENAKFVDLVETDKADWVFTNQVKQLLQVFKAGVSFSQWTAFYHNLAIRRGFLRRQRIDHATIQEVVTQFWGRRWLLNACILPGTDESSWLRGLFRKHRKSFSFAEHIVALTALSNESIGISEAIQMASREWGDRSRNKPVKLSKAVSEEQASVDQIEWKCLLKSNSPKKARHNNKALYARLYRNHYNWLMQINADNRLQSQSVNERVDWPQRDRLTAKELAKISEQYLEDLNAPHLSRTFLIHQLEHRATVEKNLDRLPRSSLLLSICTESIDEYQARRLARAFLSMSKRGLEIKRWSLLRESGLSDDRMSCVVTQLVKELLSEQSRS